MPDFLLFLVAQLLPMKKYHLFLCLLFPAFAGKAQTSDNLVKISRDGKYGFSNAAGQEVIAPVYDSAGDFRYGAAPVRQKGRFGFVFANGKKSSLKYDSVWIRKGTYDHQPLLLTLLKGKKGLLDSTGKEIIKPMYEDLRDNKEGYTLVVLNGQYGLVNAKGKMVLKPVYDNVGLVANDNTVVYLDGKCGRVDLVKGKVLMTPYEKVGPFIEGLAWVRQDKKYGFINIKGELVIPIVYDWAGNFNEGLAAAASGGKYGFIDRNNQVVIPQKYDQSFVYKDGKGMVRLNGQIGYVDRSGKETWLQNTQVLESSVPIRRN